MEISSKESGYDRQKEEGNKKKKKRHSEGHSVGRGGK